MAGVVGAGFIISVALFITFRDWERREVDARAANLVREQIEKLEVTLLRSMEVLHSVAALHSAHGGLGRTEFRQFVQHALARQPELQALSWNPRVPAARRAALENETVAEGFPHFQIRQHNPTGVLQTADLREEYVPVHFIEPLDANVNALGYDLNSDPCRRASLEQARDNGQPVATAPIHLAQDNEHKTGFLVLLPVYDGAVPASFVERRERLRGFAVAVFRVEELVREAVDSLRSRGLAVQILDQEPTRTPLFGSFPANTPASPSEVQRAPLEVAGRHWILAYHPTDRFLASHAQLQSWYVLLGGIVVTLLTAGYLIGGWRRTQQIAAANTALEQEVQIRQQAEARADAANHAKSDFLASMSHELRTPLNAILGYTQLMQRDVSLPTDQKDALHGIAGSGRHLLGLINEVLDLSKIEAGRMDLNPVDFDLRALANTLSSTFKPLCAEKRIGFRIEFNPTGPSGVQGDEGKLRQVLINLLGNAVKFTDAGEVCLRWKPESGGSWLFEVFDTGLGIPTEEQADIFKPFHQGTGARHQGGTGLGLAIAQRQVKLLGGELALESERGIGSRFFFRIPLPASSQPIPESAVATSDSERAPELPDHIEIPDQLAARLMVAAELHSTTALKAALLELRELSPEARHLADHLRHLMRGFDFDSIQRVLARTIARPDRGPFSTSSHGSFHQDPAA